MKRPLLTARWSPVFLATYAVPPALLEKRLPPGLALDLRDGQAFVSLVAILFQDTRVLGIPWPGYRTFPELNLRYYVRAGKDRGVVFIREWVPSYVVAGLARLLYNEPYGTAPMSVLVRDEPESLTAEFRLHCGGRQHLLQATGRKPALRPPDNSLEHFFKEHRWGFGRTHRGSTQRYEVVHPAWEIYPVQSYRIDLEWSAVYGPEWEFLQKQFPISTILAAGSAVSVYPAGKEDRRQ